jgi:hypothetical protein
MSKGAGLHPKANSKTKSKTSALAKVQRLTLFGSPQLLEGEDAAAYDELLSRVSAEAPHAHARNNVRVDRRALVEEPQPAGLADRCGRSRRRSSPLMPEVIITTAAPRSAS